MSRRLRCVRFASERIPTRNLVVILPAADVRVLADWVSVFAQLCDYRKPRRRRFSSGIRRFHLSLHPGSG